MKEIIFKHHKDFSNNGVITLPDRKMESIQVCVLILNSGLMPHTGTSRISVLIARKLADSGFMSVRFDFSGIGDSPARRGTNSFTDNANSESVDVMDQIEKTHGITKFVMYGLCSGADISFQVAQSDTRVVGIAQIDPYLYRNSKWYLNHYFPRLFSIRSWLTAISMLFVTTGGKGSLSNEDDVFGSEVVESADYAREIPDKLNVVSGYTKILSNNCRVLVIVTGGQLYTVNYSKQFRDIFSEIKWADNLDDYYFPEAEHVLPEPVYQKKVIATIDSWMGKFA